MAPTARHIEALSRPRRIKNDWAPAPLLFRGMRHSITVDLFYGTPLWVAEVSFGISAYLPRRRDLWDRDDVARAKETASTLIQDVGQGEIVLLDQPRSLLGVRPLDRYEREVVKWATRLKELEL